MRIVSLREFFSVIHPEPAGNGCLDRFLLIFVYPPHVGSYSRVFTAVKLNHIYIFQKFTAELLTPINSKQKALSKEVIIVHG